MNFVNIHKLSGHELYSYYNASNPCMCILGSFFSDIGDRNDIILFFQEWSFNDFQSDVISTNSTILEREDHFIYLKSSIPGDNDYDNPTLIFTHQQFFQLMHDWQEKVCKHKPKEVVIIYNNNEFTIETTN